MGLVGYLSREVNERTTKAKSCSEDFDNIKIKAQAKNEDLV